MVGRRSRSPTNRQQTRQVPDSSSADTAKFPQTFRFSNRKAFSGESSPSSTESSTAGMSVPITAGMGAALALLSVHCTRCPSTQRLRWLLMLPKPTAPNPGSQNGLRECPTPQTAPGGLIPFPVVVVGADVPLGRVPGAGWLRRSDHKFRAEPSGASGRRQVLPAHTPGAHALSRRGAGKPTRGCAAPEAAAAARHLPGRSDTATPAPTAASRHRHLRRAAAQPAPSAAANPLRTARSRSPQLRSPGTRGPWPAPPDPTASRPSLRPGPAPPPATGPAPFGSLRLLLRAAPTWPRSAIFPTGEEGPRTRPRLGAAPSRFVPEPAALRGGTGAAVGRGGRWAERPLGGARERHALTGPRGAARRGRHFVSAELTWCSLAALPGP